MNQTSPGKTHNPIQEFIPTIRVYDLSDGSGQPNGVICSINNLFNKQMNVINGLFDND